MLAPKTRASSFYLQWFQSIRKLFSIQVFTADISHTLSMLAKRLFATAASPGGPCARQTQPHRLAYVGQKRSLKIMPSQQWPDLSGMAPCQAKETAGIQSTATSEHVCCLCPIFWNFKCDSTYEPVRGAQAYDTLWLAPIAVTPPQRLRSATLACARPR